VTTERTFSCPECKALVVVKFGQAAIAGHYGVGSTDQANCPRCGWMSADQIYINDRIEAHLQTLCSSDEMR
jgi:C4-type Zn-finger protein